MSNETDMPRPRIFVSWPSYSADDPDTGKRLTDAGYEIVHRPRLLDRTEDELIDLMEGAVGAIATADPFTDRVIQSNPNLRVIARVGVGVDSVDLESATRHGIPVTIASGANAETVADQALAFMLALLRKLVVHDQAVRSGRWERFGVTTSELPGKTVGLIGAGTIGRAVTRRLAGFGASVVFFDRYVPSLDGARKMETVEELLATADIVSLHMPLTPETRHMIDAAAISLMKPTALLINTARGPLVDQEALFDALRAQRIAGAGLDVFEDEPPAPGTFDNVPNLICSPHIAGVSGESIRRMTISATSSLLAVLDGQTPDTIVNPAVLEQRD